MSKGPNRYQTQGISVLNDTDVQDLRLGKASHYSIYVDYM